MTKKSALEHHPLGKLEIEDLNMILQFVLLSGSVKNLAAYFGVSYPTMRARLDRLIERLKQAVKGRMKDPMAECLADLVQEEQLSLYAAKKIRDLHRRMVNKKEIHDE